MKRIALFAALALAGCAGTTPSPSPATMLYAASAGLDQAEVGATAYVSSPLADPAVKAEIKRLDNIAYGTIHPVLDAAAVGGSPITAAEAQAGQAALGALTSYMLTNGVH